MFLHELCGPWLKHPFWRNRFLLSEARDLALVRESDITAVVIDTDRGVDVEYDLDAPPPPPPASVAAPEQVPAAEPAPPALPPPTVGREYADAQQLCRKTKDSVASVFQQVRMGQVVDARGCVPVVEEIVESVLAKPHTLISMARLKTVDDYTHMHSVAVCGLMVALAKQLDLPPEQIRDAGLAGLLLDIGKARMPPELLNKPGRLSESELAVMQTHAKRGHKLLMEGGSVDAAILDACLHHHERFDGTGYPDRLAGEQIGLFARMAAVCDVYDAVTSRRPYRAPWDPGEAMRQMAQAKGQFDQAIFQAFVKALGIYPTGGLVRLQSERLAVVLAQSGNSLLTPKVRVFYSVEDRHAIHPFVLDLADPACGDRITGVEPPEAWRFPPLEKLWAGSAK